MSETSIFSSLDVAAIWSLQAFEPEVLIEESHEPENREIFSTEMTKNEFADILKLTQDSMFVELMFELADKDKNGTISFREFLDVTVIFAEGSWIWSHNLLGFIRSQLKSWKIISASAFIDIFNDNTV